MFFFYASSPSATYSLSLHDALPICDRVGLPTGAELTHRQQAMLDALLAEVTGAGPSPPTLKEFGERSEEHTSELQSPCNLVCRLLLEKKNRSIYCTILLLLQCTILS